ncbi:MAG: alternative ribosome rescue aminoacyl-tRNA hydrolase ArfB [Steroidobacteraceae bacterium]|jgi:ribosome-associated protein|nr:aminoacyl-tRNA hydrolase [Gammaproteobacteria bacterium]
MPIFVGDVVIPDADLSVAFMRSGGPGGQNVNKVSSAVQLRFDLIGSEALRPAVKARLRTLVGHRLTDEGAILIVARTHRSQEQNRREAEERLADFVRRALVEPRIRRATKPTRASKLRRLESKTRRAGIKRGRGTVRDD